MAKAPKKRRKDDPDDIRLTDNELASLKPAKEAWPASKREKFKKRGTDHDFAVNAFRVVEQAIGEKMDGSPLPESTKNPHAVALGKLGGQKGGKARAKALSKAKRIAIAKKAAKSRWGR